MQKFVERQANGRGIEVWEHAVILRERHLFVCERETWEHALISREAQMGGERDIGTCAGVLKEIMICKRGNLQ